MSIRHSSLAPLDSAPEWASPTDVADVFGFDRRRASQLIACGALGKPYETANGRLQVEPTHLRILEREGRTRLADVPDGLAVKIGVAEPEPNPDLNRRQWWGWDSTLSAEDRRLSATGWIRIREPERFIGLTLFATVNQVVVEVFTITGVETRPEDSLIVFTTTDSPERDAWIKLRLATRRGPAPDLTGSLAADRDATQN